jgi:hypothetical protein
MQKYKNMPKCPSNLKFKKIIGWQGLPFPGLGNKQT